MTYSNLGSVGAARVVKPMKSRSTLTLRPPSTLPFSSKALLASEGVLKVTVATNGASSSAEVGQRDMPWFVFRLCLAKKCWSSTFCKSDCRLVTLTVDKSFGCIVAKSNH